MDIKTEINPPIDCETKLYLIDTLEKLIRDITYDKVDKVNWCWNRNTVPVPSPSSDGTIIGFNKDPKVFTCTIQYAGETEFVPIEKE